jgi:serine protease AprX
MLNVTAMTAATPQRRTTVGHPAALILSLAVVLAGLAASTLGSMNASSAAAATGSLGNTIVRARPGHEAAAEALVLKLGGSIGCRLRIIDGFSATLPAGTAGAMRASGDVLSVTPNRQLQAQSSSYSVAYDPSSDGYSMAQVTQLSGARAWWQAGYTGEGVDVALIDSGVSPVDGLSKPGKIVNGPDLSFESQAANLTYLDSFGHGTFIAGLIAGQDSPASAGAPASTYLGMAPDARIVSLKVATADGGTDVTQVISAIDWVVQHRSDNGLNIRTINLSYATNSQQDAAVDPLAYAAEQAWKKGLVVVAAGGNYGFQSHMNNAPALGDPAFDRYVIAVGSSDSRGTPSLADDAVPDFTPWPKRGATRSVDLVAQGVHLQGLRVENAFIDTTHPEGLLDSRFFRGSGTSESAALVSGAVALILQKYPGATPDQVKRLLQQTAYPIKAKAQQIGAGELQLGPALAAALPGAVQTWPSSTGTGSIEGSRGTDRITRDGVVLSGEQDIFGAPVDTSLLAAAEAAGNSWSGGTWNGNSWSGNSWSGNSWSGNTWAGDSWSGNSWSGNSWSTGTWSGNSWSGHSWSSTDWSGNSWSGNSWSGGSWAGDSWG